MLRNALRPLRSQVKPRSTSAPLRAFSQSSIARVPQDVVRDPVETPMSLFNFTEEENMLRESGEWMAELPERVDLV
jgi:hypothetical protein